MHHPIHCALCGVQLTDAEGVVLINTRVQLTVGCGDVWTCDAHAEELQHFDFMAQWARFTMSAQRNETVH